MKKRLLSALLVLVMILTMLPVAVMADEVNEDTLPVSEEPAAPEESEKYTLDVEIYLDGKKVAESKDVYVTGAEEGSYEAGALVNLTAVYGEGYEFVYWINGDESKIDLSDSLNPTITIVMPGENATIRACFATKTVDSPVDPQPPVGQAAYTVNHWVETWNSYYNRTDYVLEDAQIWFAGAGDYVTVQANSYAHHHLDERNSQTSGQVTADGKLVLNLYYDLDLYEISYVDGVRGVEIFKTQTYYAPYGAPTPKFDNRGDKLGPLFLGWYPAVSRSVTGDVTYVAQWADWWSWDGNNVKKPTAPMNFDDVRTSDWFYKDVKFVYENGLMEGVSASKFDPYATLTRGMAATILYRMEGAPKTRYNGMFRDVDNYKWYTDGVEWAAANGIVEGFEDGKFRPNDYVTREQLATMLYRYASYKNYDTTARENLAVYKDGGSVHGYAVSAVSWSLAEHLITDTNGHIQPRADATRVEVAVSIATFCRAIP